jgi:histone acetyltransferase (RNA polymerase elongator complex component)
MVNRYHSYTKQEAFQISDMHPAHIANAIAVIRAGEHPYYTIKHSVYQALLEQLAENTILSTVKRVKTSKKPPTNLSDVVVLRKVAKQVVKKYGVVSADTLRKFAVKRGLHVPNIAYCSVFRTRDFQVIGRKRSTSPSANGREIRVYVEA